MICGGAVVGVTDFQQVLALAVWVLIAKAFLAPPSQQTIPPGRHGTALAAKTPKPGTRAASLTLLPKRCNQENASLTKSLSDALNPVAVALRVSSRYNRLGYGVTADDGPFSI